MTSGSLFQLRKMQKRLGSFTLDIQSLDVQRGEVLALLGPTGAGKSTLLRLLADLLKADHGNLYFDGQGYQSHDLDLSTRRRMTLVHQRPLLQTGTVRFNVEYGLRLRKQQDISDKVDCMIECLELSELAHQLAGTLSGGQTQLVALARALVLEPEVLLLDEPTAHLDPAHVALVEQTIHQIRQQRRMTVVWATHNLFQARRVADRTAFLLAGQLIEATPTDEFFTNPCDPRSIDFVQGRMVY